MKDSSPKGLEGLKTCAFWMPDSWEKWGEDARLCGEPGRLYPSGIRCDKHQPAKMWKDSIQGTEG